MHVVGQALGWILAAMSSAVLLDIIVPILILGMAEFLSWLFTVRWKGGGLFIYGPLLAISCGIVAYSVFVPKDAPPTSRSHARDDRPSWEVWIEVPITILPPIVIFVVGAGEFLRYWSLAYGGFSPAAVTDYWSWSLYGLSWVLENGLANVGPIWGWSVSDIQPVTETTRTLVWGYNLLLEFLTMAAVARILHPLVNRRRPASKHRNRAV
jgi:hypothetical protein